MNVHPIIPGLMLALLFESGCSRRQPVAEAPQPVTEADPVTNARLLARRGDHPNARRQWAEVLARQPGNAEARLGVATAYVKMGEPSLAVNDLDAMLRERPDWVLALYVRGLAAHEMGDPALGKRNIGQALDSDVELTTFLELMHLDTDTEKAMRQNFGEVRRELDRLIEARPNHAECRESRGLTFLVEAERSLKRSDFQRAEAEFTEAIRLATARTAPPEPFYYRANRGYTRLCLGDSTGADTDLKSARMRLNDPSEAEAIDEKIAQARSLQPRLK